MRLIVADAKEHARRSLVEFLELQPGIDVVGEAADRLDAVRLAEDLRPNLVIMDVNMPSVDGLDATQQMRQLAPKPVVILLTVHLDSHIRISALEAGAFACVERSAGIDRLIDTINTVPGKGTGNGRRHS